MDSRRSGIAVIGWTSCSTAFAVNIVSDLGACVVCAASCTYLLLGTDEAVNGESVSAPSSRFIQNRSFGERVKRLVLGQADNARAFDWMCTRCCSAISLHIFAWIDRLEVAVGTAQNTFIVSDLSGRLQDPLKRGIVRSIAVSG